QSALRYRQLQNSSMLKKIFYVASILLFNSCIGDIEKLKLDKYSEKNKSYEIEVFEKHFDEKDSLLSQKIKLMVFDRKNRLINENNSIFYFYNSKNKITEVKSIYRRGLKTSILEYDCKLPRKQYGLKVEN